MRFLIDTDILIDYTRRIPAAIEFFKSIDHKPFVSAITVAEIYSGIRDGQERQSLERARFGFDIVAIDDFIAERGGLTYRAYFRSHGVGIADAIIAASSEAVDARLVTRNLKHFPMLKDVLVPY